MPELIGGGFWTEVGVGVRGQGQGQGQGRDHNICRDSVSVFFEDWFKATRCKFGNWRPLVESGGAQALFRSVQVSQGVKMVRTAEKPSPFLTDYFKKQKKQTNFLLVLFVSS